MALITEMLLRQKFQYKDCPTSYIISKKDTLTPSAYDFLKERKISIIVEDSDIPIHDSTEISFSKPLNKDDWETPKEYKNYYTNEVLSIKPESMTHLFENILVAKDDPRIILRGRLDTLQAYIIDTQVLFHEKNRDDLVNSLEDLLHYAREILKYEVINQPFPDLRALGMNAEEIREKSHHPETYFNLKQMVLVHYKFGAIVSKLNFLRAYSRECELIAVTAVKDSNPLIVQALNRLSSCFHILIYQELSIIQGNKHG